MKLFALREHWRSFLGDETGSISIEFVILMPLLAFLMTGGLTYWDAFYSNSRTAKVAYAVNDIMTRHDVVDSTDMAFVTAVVDKMLPADLDNRVLRISSICFENGSHKVMWSYVANGGNTVVQALEDDDIPLALLPEMAPQDSVILTELRARWQPKFLNVGLGEKRWHSELVGRPRFKKMIPHTDINPANLCPAGAGA